MLLPSLTHYKIRLNAKLTCEEEAQVKRAMSESFNRLSAVENETVRLRDRLVVLYQKKKETEHFIKVQQGLLSPIRRLHPDILQEIFCRCLPTAHNSVPSLKEAPLLLSRVCSLWRQVAYSTPRLWSSLHINTASLTSPVCRARLEAFDAWLNRSGMLPLSISMSTLMNYDMLLHEFQSYFNLIVKHVRRWKYVYIQAGHLDQMDVPLEINANDLPLLEVFCIRTQGTKAPSLLEKNGILTAPSLRVVSVHDSSLRLLDLPVQWSKLTGLDTAFSDLSDVLRILSICSNLETCALNVGSPYLSSTMEESSDLRPTIVLPHLRTLNIYGAQLGGSNNLSTILNNLSAPALRHFGCPFTHLSSIPSSNLPLLDHSLSSKHFGSFFQRLNEPLEEMGCTDLGGDASDVMELLYLSPGLKRLSLSCYFFTPASLERSFNDRLLSKFIPYGHRSHCYLCSFVEEPEGEEQLEVGGSDLTPSTCLCPNLEVLQLDGAYFSRHILLEFLRSRLVDYDKYGIARLRRFSISFDSRWDNEDMKKDIDLLAEKSGSVVRLKCMPPIRHARWRPDLPPHRDPFIEELPGF